jgi:hypothetical protein
MSLQEMRGLGAYAADQLADNTARSAVEDDVGAGDLVGGVAHQRLCGAKIPNGTYFHESDIGEQATDIKPIAVYKISFTGRVRADL